MTRNLVRSLAATFADEDSQASQNKLLFLMQEHGIGVTTSSPILDNEPQSSTKVLTSAQTRRRKRQSRRSQVRSSSADNSRDQLPLSASDVSTDAQRHDTDAGAVSTSSTERPRQNLRGPRSAALHPSEPNHAQTNSQPLPCETHSIENPHHSVTRTPPFSPESKKRISPMDSGSPTQSNDGRSYEQYARDDSQPPSLPGSPTEDRRTLREGDTGYVDLRCPFEEPDAAPFQADTPPPPETPATLPHKSFLSGGDEHLIAPSQLFGQTQPTSALKKASPTSSRPSPNVLRKTSTSPIQPISSPLNPRGLATTSLPRPSSDIPEHSPRHPGRRTPRSASLTDVLDAAEDREGSKLGNLPSPELDCRSGRTGLEPLNEYRPYRKRGSKLDAARSSSQISVDSDFEQDEAELRRRRAKSNKERASRSFPEISLNLSQTDVEVPSTNRTKYSSSRSGSKEYLDQDRGRHTTDNVGSQETVADSQDVMDQRQSASRNVDSALLTTFHRESGLEVNNHQSITAARDSEEREIPETSPVHPPAEPSKTVGDIIQVKSSASMSLPALSVPTSSMNVLVEPSDSFNTSQPEINPSATAIVNQRNTDTIEIESSPAVVLASSEQNHTHRGGRLSRRVASSLEVPESLEPSDSSMTSSAITVLSTTPVVSSGVTHSSEDDQGQEVPDDTIVVSAPVTDGFKDRDHQSLPDASPSSVGPTPRTRAFPSARTGARQSSRRGSVALDELDKSNAPAAKNSRSVTRKLPRKSTTLRELQTRRGIFEGMVFAISFQERQQPPKTKPQSKRSLEDMIRQEGGTILDDGFNPLFEFDSSLRSAQSPSTPTLSNTFKLLDDSVGFAALIADGHSRKVKYMQALALGIPCLAPRWVTTCVAKKEIVDWSPYLLCAGPSALLGDAIRSRNLPPYDATTAKLAEVISNRPKLLDGSRILLIMKKTKNEEKRMPYVFLAQVLGATLVRVHSIEEARIKLQEAESSGDDFGWVYVNDQIQDARAALFGIKSNERSSKKRGRTVAEMDDDRPPKRIRTLNDELVIQSLILGRLIEEDELEE